MRHPASGVTVRVQSLVVAFAMAFAFAGSAMAQMSDVIISQYVESGAGGLAPNSDAIELYNGTGAPIDLAAGGYKLLRYDNGATSPSATINLSGTIASRGTRLYVNAATTTTALSAKADVLDAAIAFTGDDAIVLVKGVGNTVVDSFGQVGNNPIGEWGSGSTGTQTNSLIRKPSIKAGRTASTSTFTPSDQWQADSAGYLNSLGSHTAYYAYGLPASTLSSAGVPSADGWALYQSGCTGEFRGDSGGNGLNTSSGAGAGANAWGIWSSNGPFCNADSSIWATQMLDGALQTGQSVSIDFDHGTIRTGKYVAVEFLYVDSEGLTNGLAAQLYFVGGDSYYKLADSTTRTTTIPYTADGGTITLRITGTNTYSLSYRGVTYTGTLGVSAPTVNAVRVVNKAANDEYRYNGDEGNVFFNNLVVGCIDVDNDGVCAGTDCNDNNAAVYPGAPELCATAGTDNDCDGNASEVDANAADRSTFYADADGDTYGNAAVTQLACSAPAGYVANNTDCNDASAAIKPGAAELCATAGTDNDCDGDAAEIDANAADKVNFYADADNDTYTVTAATLLCPGSNPGYRAARSTLADCNDNNNAIKPGATDVCDGVDNNCDGTIDSSSCSSITPSGNGGSSFAGAAASGAIGGSTLDVSFSGANVVFTITKGAAAFNDSLVLYIDSASGGFSTTSGFTDTGDASRKAISGYNGSTRSTVNFASGFTANYALYISPGTNVYAGAWSLANGGAHAHMGAATMSPSSNANAATYTVTIPRSYLGILPGQQFKFVGTYLNPLTAVRSNEGYGEGLPASGNVSGAATFTTWLTATAPCTGSETVTAPFDGTLGDMFSGASNQWLQSQPCGSGDYRLTLVRDGQSGVNSTWRGPRFDGSVDSFTAEFKFSFKNGGGNTGDGFSFFWGNASDFSGTRWQGDEDGVNAFRTDGAGLQVGFKGYVGGGGQIPGVTPKWGNTALATKYTQNFDAINYRNNDWCYASDDARMAKATVAWTRGQGVTITLQMPGAGSATTIFNNVGSATLANINPSNWYFGFAGRNGGIDQDVIIGDFIVTVSRSSATYYVDIDGDGYGAVGSDLDACQSAIPAGYIATGGDCDDTDTAIHPGAAETCANLAVDNDCDGIATAAEATDSTTYYADADGDSFSVNTTAKFCTAPNSGYRLTLSSPADCNDADPLTYPGAAETCANLGTDNDCDGVNTDAEASDAGTYYADADNDTYTVAAATLLCPANATGYRASRSARLDCNDNNAAIKPGATDVCDGVDNNCDGTIDPSSCASITPAGNGGGSFAGAAASGAIGGSTLNVSFSGANVVFTITKGAAAFNDSLVLYIDSASGGFSNTSGFTDTGDASRKAISGYNGSTRSTVNFASGFTANYALYISPGTNVYAGAWSLANGGAHTHMGAATMSPSSNANAATYTVTIPRSYLGILPGQQFKFVGTYLNPLTAVRSNEGYGEGLPASGNVSGAATFTTWLTATAPCTGVETVSPAWDGTIGTLYGNSEQNAPCGTGTPGRLKVVIDGRPSTYGTWRSAPFDGEVDSMSASFKFSLRNGGGSPGDGFCFFWGDASDMSGSRWNGGEGGLNALQAVGNPGLQIGFTTYASSTPGVEAKWGSTPLASKYQQNFSSINYGGSYSGDDTCYASDSSRMATVTVNWTRGSGVTVTLQMPGAASATTILNNVGSATLANIHPENWHFGFAGRNGAVDQHVIIGDCTVSVTRTDATYYVDVDGDGYGAVGSDLDACRSAIPAGYIATGGDCDDTDTAIKPGAAETCANLGTDNDCDGVNTAAEASDSTSYYADGDADGYTVSAPTAFCTAPVSGYLAAATVGVDCNDANAAVYPGAPELCATAGVDNDCDGNAAETDANAADRATFYRDQDGDTYGTSANSQLACTAPTGYVANSTDCNDANAAIHPGAVEICDGIDNDCANGIDDGLTAITYYRDVDGDGYGNAGVTTMTCNGTAPSGFVANSTDCDDTSSAIRPGAAELCLTVGVDNNCNGNANDVDANAADKVLFYRDQDNDTYTLATGANFCPGTTNAGYRAARSSPLDCDDSAATTYPGAAENCANLGTDNDCDGVNDAAEASDSQSYYVDGDGDTYGAVGATGVKSCSPISGSVTDNTDCNDGNPAINPGATEICDSSNVDENCNGTADNNDSGATGKTAFYADNDGDGYGAGAANQRCDAVGSEVVNNTDCDDADATRSPVTVWYPDADGDGRGVSAGAVTQCARPGSLWARAEGDLCPNDPLKTDPGTCGCGTVDADLNGNGVPDCSDNTPPAVRLALLTEDANIGSGEKLYVTVAVQNGPVQGVGAQVVLAYDRTKLSLDTNYGSGGTFYDIPEGSMLDMPLFAQHDASAGKLIVALGTGVGNSNLAVGGALLKLRFTCIGDYANAANAVSFTTWNTFQSSIGNAASQSVGVGAPANLPPVTATPGRVTFTAVPAPVAYWADANGSGTAAVTIVPPTARDAASQALSVSWTRSDGGPNLTTFPSGITTITWSATDGTGNTSTATTMVNVSADSLMMADVALGGNYTASAFTRGIQVAARKGSANDTDVNTVILNQSSSGGNYRAEGRAMLAVAGGTDWTAGCAAVRDPLHTLRRALAVTKTTVAGSMGGRSYNSAYVVDGTDPSDYLLSGNVDGNTVIDILDYGTFVNQRGVLLPVNTYAGVALPHSDLNGSGQVTLGDLTFIQANIFKQDEQCTAAAGETPIRKITVRELRRLGLGDMAAADMNGDGVLDATDLALAMQGAEHTEDAGTPDAEQPAGNAQE